jgi:hypothetical protein
MIIKINKSRDIIIMINLIQGPKHKITGVII